MDSLCVGRIIGVDPSGNVHDHHAVRRVLLIDMERIDQHMAVKFIDVVQSNAGIQNWIHPCVGFPFLTKIKVQRMNLNGILDVITQRVVALREFLRQGIHHRKKASCKKEKRKRKLG